MHHLVISVVVTVSRRFGTQGQRFSAYYCIPVLTFKFLAEVLASLTFVLLLDWCKPCVFRQIVSLFLFGALERSLAADPKWLPSAVTTYTQFPGSLCLVCAQSAEPVRSQYCIIYYNSPTDSTDYWIFMNSH